MKDEKYYLLLTRFMSLEIQKEDVKEYLEEWGAFNEKIKYN